MPLTPELARDFLERGYSRRCFTRLAAMLTAAASMPFYNEPALAQRAGSRSVPAGAVKLDANENPLGPCPEALQAIRDILPQGGRYMFDYPSEFEAVLAQAEGLPASCVQAYPGSSMPLHWSVLAFTSPSRAYVAADTTFEAGESAARFIGARVVRVPLTKNYAHDARAMAAVPDAGLIYVCNPNNPTGTLTPREDLEYLLANKPPGCIVLLDEAYIHYTELRGPIDLVAAGKDLVILRTFSKIYGMAGLRCGAALARPDLLARIRMYGNTWMPVTSLAGAIASLKVPNLVPERRRLTAATRQDIFRFFDQHGFSYLPAVANFFMVGVKRPGREVAAALRQSGVLVGRSWPTFPNHIRVTIGTPEEMERFKTAFLKAAA